MKILEGIGTSFYIGVGRVRKIEKDEDIPRIKEGEIVVVSKASRDMLLHLQKAGGVVTDYGGITSHVAIVLRELKAGSAPVYRQIPLTVLMVAYTFLGLWLLSAPTV